MDTRLQHLGFPANDEAGGTACELPRICTDADSPQTCDNNAHVRVTSICLGETGARFAGSVSKRIICGRILSLVRVSGVGWVGWGGAGWV